MYSAVMSYDAVSSWQAAFDSRPAAYPSEGLVRLLRGSYPDRPALPSSGKALDIGCGDGRNTQLLASSGFDALGTEIHDDIVKGNQRRFPGIQFETAFADDLPYGDGLFDLVVAWNSAYYVSARRSSLETHFHEFQRVTSDSGFLIVSVPQPTNFIYQGAVPISNWHDDPLGQYVEIRKDPFGIRNGEVMGIWHDQREFEGFLSRFFGGPVSVSEQMGNWFGLQYDWWVAVVGK